jgi:hypothetical protein
MHLGLAEWSVPAAALALPGSLVLVAVLLQVSGGAAWMRFARRTLATIAGDRRARDRGARPRRRRFPQRTRG